MKYFRGKILLRFRQEGKRKQKEVPKEVVMMQRTEKSGIEANIIEHRPLYLFGLNLENETLTPLDRTEKAKKSHEACVTENLEFLEGIDTPLANAFRNFLLKWNPEEETENVHLLQLGKDYAKSIYAFCLSGSPQLRLHEVKELKQKWDSRYEKKNQENQDDITAQCAISGKMEPPARIHLKIKKEFMGAGNRRVY